MSAGQRLLLNNYRQAPVVMSRGEGCVLWDADGRRYLDMTAGIAVCVLGHGHAGLADAIAAQARQLIHASNLYYLENQVRLAEALARRAFRGRVFFCNSGTEANEAALKLARRYQAVVAQERPERVELVAFENSFHGRTMGALSVTGQEQVPRGLRPAGRAGALPPVRRHRRRARRHHRQDLRRDPRADPGRGRHPAAAARLPPGAARALLPRPARC